jgi:hypothetical protein
VSSEVAARFVFLSLKAFCFFGFPFQWIRDSKRLLGTGNGVSRCSTCYPCAALAVCDLVARTTT